MTCDDLFLPFAADWRMWRDVLLRSAGLPVDEALRLAAPRTAAAVDAALDAAEREAALRAAAVASLDDLLRDERVRGRGKAWAAARRAVVRGAAVVGEPPDGAWPSAVRSHAQACAEVDRLRRVAATIHAEDARATTRVLRDVAADPRFREALAWQNRAFLDVAVGAIERDDENARDKDARRRQLALARYVLRYATKNDTIGFFGPMKWSTIDAHSATTSVRAGERFLAERRTFVEHWALDAVAARIAALPGVRPWLPPRRSPLVDVVDGAVRTPFDRQPADAKTLAVLAACDGATRAIDLARAVAARADLATTTDEVLGVLAEQADAGNVVWTLDVPTRGRAGFVDFVRARVAAIDDVDARAVAEALLARVVEPVAALGRAAGDATRVATAMKALEDAFTDASGVAAARHGGAWYGARTVAHEDCVRDVALVPGRDFVGKLRPLDLVMKANRWLSTRIRAVLQRKLDDVHAQARADVGDDVPLVLFLGLSMSSLPGMGAPTDPDVLAEVAEATRRWAAILRPAPGAREVVRTYDDLALAVDDAFATAGAGWPVARCHSVDVLLAASGPDAVRRGAYRVVLGEPNPWMIALEQEAIYEMHPSRDAFQAALRCVFPTGTVSPVLPKDRWVRAITQCLAEGPDDFVVEFDASSSSVPRSRVLPAGDLFVRRTERGLVVATRDGARSWPLFVALDRLMYPDPGPFLPAAPRTPRIVVDDVVLQRERWSFAAAELAFAAAADEHSRYAGARAWRRAHDMPRFVFVHASCDQKPFYVDFDSPVCVESFAHLARKSDTIAVSEMLPSPAECWLPDAEGRLYTAELRTLVVDQRPHLEHAP